MIQAMCDQGLAYRSPRGSESPENLTMIGRIQAEQERSSSDPPQSGSWIITSLRTGHEVCSLVGMRWDRGGSLMRAAGRLCQTQPCSGNSVGLCFPQSALLSSGAGITRLPPLSSLLEVQVPSQRHSKSDRCKFKFWLSYKLDVWSLSLSVLIFIMG